MVRQNPLKEKRSTSTHVPDGPGYVSSTGGYSSPWGLGIRREGGGRMSGGGACGIEGPDYQGLGST